MDIIKTILSMDDPVKKRAYFTALISSEIEKLGGKKPIVVGGEALEIYTQGSYTTGDIDLKAPKELLEVVLTRLNFKKIGRLWMNEELDIYIDWLGEALEEGEEAEEKVVEIELSDGYRLRLISIEDLIIDRLNAYKWWNDQDSKMWAKTLLEISREISYPMDWEYLTSRSIKEEIQDIIEGLRQDYEQKGQML